MAQTWTDDTFAAGHVAQTDLQNMENNFACLKSSFSGAAAPAGPVAGQLWFETDQKVLKTRDAGNASWYGLMHGDIAEKRIVYRDAAMDGYARASTIVDKVVALKSTAGTWVTGGSTAGSMTLTGFSAMQYKWYDYVGGAAADKDGAGTVLARSAIRNPAVLISALTAGYSVDQDMYTNSLTPTHDGTDRLAAAICIVENLDL